jgi:hypothetical protein
MVSSPGFGRIEQRLPDPAGATLWRHGQILDPGPLPESYRDNVEIDRRESNDCLIFIRHQNGRPIIRHGCFEAINRNCRRPVSRAYTRSGHKPLVGNSDLMRVGGTCVPDHPGEAWSCQG